MQGAILFAGYFQLLITSTLYSLGPSVCIGILGISTLLQRFATILPPVLLVT